MKRISPKKLCTAVLFHFQTLTLKEIKLKLTRFRYEEPKLEDPTPGSGTSGSITPAS